MNPSRERLIRWATRGALILAGVSTFFGALFTFFVALVEQALPISPAGWAMMLIGIVLLWGGGGLFFGAILGIYACMIWRDPNV
jgi:hypothetical protein